MNIFIGLPAYNEEDSIAPLFKKLFAFQKKIDQKVVVITYDDGSTDSTRAKIDDWSTRLNLISNGYHKNYGLGNALNKLFNFFMENSNEGDLLVIMDCDDTQDPIQIIEMLNKIKEEPSIDIVIASRYRPDSSVKGLAIHRVYLSMLAAGLYKLVFPYKGVRDYTCGYRLYTHEIVHAAMNAYGKNILQEKNFSSMVELLLKMGTVGAKFEEISLRLAYDQKKSSSKMNVIKNSFRLLRNLFIWKFRGFKNK